MPSFLSKVFGRNKGIPSTQWDSGELLGGKFEAISPNVSPTAAKFLDLEQSAKDGSEIDKEHGFAFFRSKSRPSSPEVKPTTLFDTLPPLSLNFDDLKDGHTSIGHIFEELDADATLPEAVIGRRRLNPFEALLLIRACSQAITSRGLETLGVMTPHWYSASPEVQRSLISRYLTSLNTMSPTTATSSFSPQVSNFEYEVELTRSIHDVAAVLRWGLRHLQLEGDTFGTDDGWYKAFLDAEAADDYPPKAFSEKLASKLPLLHLDLLLTTLELFSSFASLSESNGTSGSKLSKIFGLWLLTARRVEDKDDWRTFYARWERTGRMLEHLFLARIRDQSTDHRMPVRLVELVRKYPYTHGLSSPTTDLQLLPRPQLTTTFHDALLVRVGYEVSSQNQVPTSKINPSVLLADALSTKVEGEYAELWAKITAAASKTGTEAPLSNVFADETLRLLSLVAGKPKEDAKSPTFSLLSLVETHRASTPTGVSVSAKPHLDIGSITTPLSPLNIGSDWEHFSNSGFLDVSPNILPLASTLFDTDIEKTTPPELLAPISRKSSRRVSAPKKVEISMVEASSQEPVEPPSQPQQVITSSGFEIVQIDEAFVDFWSDALLDPIASNWPAFVLCKFKPALVPELNFGSERHKTITWLVLEQMFTVKPPAPPPQPVPPPPADEVEQSATPVPQSPSGRRRFNFWSISRTTSASSTGSQKTKKASKALKVNELGEVVEGDVKQDTIKIKLPGMKRKISEGKKAKERMPENQESAKSMDLKPSSTLPAVLESTADASAITSSVVAATAAITAEVVDNVPEPEVSPLKEALATSEMSGLHVDAIVSDSTTVEGTPAETNPLMDIVPVNVAQTSVVEPRLDDATENKATDIPSSDAEAELISSAAGELLPEGSPAGETVKEEAELEGPKCDQEELSSIPMAIEDVENGRTEVLADGNTVEIVRRDYDQNAVEKDSLTTAIAEASVPGPESAQSEPMAVSHVEALETETLLEEEPVGLGPLSDESQRPVEELPEATLLTDTPEGAPAFEASLIVETIVTEEFDFSFKETEQLSKLSAEDTAAEEPVVVTDALDANDESSAVEVHAIAKETTLVAGQLSEEDARVSEDLASQPELVVEQEQAVDDSTTIRAAETGVTMTFVEEHSNVASEGTHSQDALAVGESALAPGTALDAEEVVVPAKEISESEVDMAKQETPLYTEAALDFESEALAGPIQAPDVEVPLSTVPEAALVSEPEVAAPSVGDVPPAARDVTGIQEASPITATPEAEAAEPAPPIQPPISEPAALAETIPLEATEGMTDFTKEADEASDVPDTASVEETTIVAETTSVAYSDNTDKALDIEVAAAPVEEPPPVAIGETPAEAAQVHDVVDPGVEEETIEETLQTPETAVPTQETLPMAEATPAEGATVGESPATSGTPVIETQNITITEALDPLLEGSPTDLPTHAQEKPPNSVEAAHCDVSNISEKVEGTESVEDISQLMTEGPVTLDVDASNVPDENLLIDRAAAEAAPAVETEASKETADEPSATTGEIATEAPVVELVNVCAVDEAPVKFDEALATLEENPTAEEHLSVEPVDDEDLVALSTVMKESTPVLCQPADLNPSSAANADVVVAESQKIPTAVQSPIPAPQEPQFSIEESVTPAGPDVTTGSDTLNGHASALLEATTALEPPVAAPEPTAVLDEVSAEVTLAEVPPALYDETNSPAVEEPSPVATTIDEKTVEEVAWPQEEPTPILEEVGEVVEEAVPNEAKLASVGFPEATVDEQSHGGDAIASLPQETYETTLDVPPAAVVTDIDETSPSPAEVQETEATSTALPIEDEARGADDSVASSNLVSTDTVETKKEAVLAESEEILDGNGQRTKVVTDETETNVAEPAHVHGKADIHANAPTTRTTPNTESC